MARYPHVPTCALMVLAALASGCEFQLCADREDLPQAGLDSARSPIIGGSVDHDNRATVALLLTLADGKRALCSGSVIARDGSRGWVLTAAHCATGSVDAVFEAADYLDCTGQGDPAGCFASYAVTGWVSHPAYNPDIFTNDFAVVTFEGASDATTVVPVGGAVDALVVGQSVELSGYGRTYAGPNNPSGYQTKRNHVTTSVAMLSPSTVRIDATTGKTACFGDSGGPAYATVAGQRRVVGVASTADQNCATVANYARVSDVYAEFIAPLLPRGQQGGSSSSSSSTSSSASGTSSAAAGGGADPSGSGGWDGSSTSSSVFPTSGGGDGAGAGDGSGGHGHGGAPGDGGAGGSPGVQPPDLGDFCVPVALECSARPGTTSSGSGWWLLIAALGWRQRRARLKR